ncbi:MAG: O-antigen ligase family protein [Parvibaculaceae bacterium]|nr:O-antigen ligase family protein [Parvibaculaceae bacterium]
MHFTDQSKDPRTTSTPFKVVLLPYLALLSLAPLPLASNRPFPEALLALGAGLLLLASLAYPELRARALTQFHRHKAPLLLFGTVCLWILFQWSTWSPSILHHPIWQFTAQTLSLPLESRISINPDGTLRGLMHILTYWSIGWVGLLLAERQRTADIILKTLIVAGCCYAFYGIVIYFTGNKSILVYEKWAYHASLTSTFVNRNSYATYAGLTLLLSVGYICQKVKPITRATQAFPIKLKALLEFLFQHQLWQVIGALLLMTSLALTASRAGAASSLVALALLILFVFQTKKSGKQQTNWIALVSILGAATLVFVVSAGQLGTRVEGLLAHASSPSRWEAYILILRIIADAPLLGIGLGGFEDIFQYYRDMTLPAPFLWDKAHNTYLELLLELGVPAALMYFAAIALFIRSAFRGVMRRKSGKLYPIIGFSAAVLVCLHSLVDFSLQIPAVSVSFAAILGVSLAQSQRKPNRQRV